MTLARCLNLSNSPATHADGVKALGRARQSIIAGCFCNKKEEGGIEFCYAQPLSLAALILHQRATGQEGQVSQQRNDSVYTTMAGSVDTVYVEKALDRSSASKKLEQ